MNKTLVAFALLLATSYAWITGNVDVSSTTSFTSSSGITVYGAASDAIGYSVANAGDFNKDTYQDYLIGTSSSKAYIIFGTSSAKSAAINLASTSLAKTEVLKFVFSDAVTGTGTVIVSAAGDLNKDGYDDIALAVPNMDGANAGQGKIVVYYGISNTAITALSSATITFVYATAVTASSGYFWIYSTANPASSHLGISMAAVGDFARNGVDDLLIACPGAAAGVGEAYIINGIAVNANGVNQRSANIDVDTLTAAGVTNGYAIAGQASDALNAVAYAGDVNGDGFPDALISATANNMVYLLYGDIFYAAPTLATSPTATDTFDVYVGSTTGVGFGTNVGYAGDLNGDGADDLFIGAPLHTTNTGKVYVIWGVKTQAKLGGLTTSDSMSTSGITITGAATATYTGQASDGGADVNNDDVDDLIVCAPGAQTGGTYTGITGKCYVIFGRTTISNIALSTALSTTSSPATGYTITGVQASGFGADVSTVGDVNNDQGDDFVISAPAGTYTGVVSSGLVYQFHGVGVTTTTTTGSGFRLGASLLVFVSFFAALIF